jgi:hypothetical protein
MKAGKDIASGIKTAWDAVSSTTSKVWDTVSTKIGSAINGAKKTVETAIGKIKGFLTGEIDVSEVFESIKSTISTKIESARDTVKNAIDKIKGFFNFSWKLPDLKLPHIEITGSFKLNPPSVPHLSVDWYAKAMNNPYLFTQPTIVGAGEAGAEVMYGRDNLMRDIAQATAANNESLIDGIYVAFSTALRQADLTEEINEREFGRIVRAARL